MILPGTRAVDLQDEDQGEIKLLIILPRNGEPWGVAEPLRSTPWGKQLQEVSGISLSHALHGHATPLVRELGPHPHYLGKRMGREKVMCTSRYECPMAADHCYPNKDMPLCYQPPTDTSESVDVVLAITHAWAEGRYVIIPVGEEFSF